MARTREVPRFPTVLSGETMTKQSMKNECDINVIMKKFEKTGVVTHLNERQGNYVDFSEGFDFHSCMNRVKAATDMFMTLPASLRGHFNNDPGYFLEFVSNPANEGAMIDLGLKKKPEVAPATPAAAPVEQAAPAPVAGA